MCPVVALSLVVLGCGQERTTDSGSAFDHSLHLWAAVLTRLGCAGSSKLCGGFWLVSSYVSAHGHVRPPMPGR